MNPDTSYRALPLEGLVQRLQLAGFRLSPTDRIRFMEVLHSDPASALLHQPHKLKYLLAPVVAKSASEQDKFYLLFDQYLTEISKPPVLAVLPRKKRYVIDILWWALPVLLLLGSALYLLFPKPPAPSLPSIVIDGPTQASPGENLTFVARITHADTHAVRITWELLDGMDTTLEVRADHRLRWSIPALANGHSPIKIVRATMRVPGYDQVFSTGTVFAIFCPNPPQLAQWAPPENLEVNVPFTFSPPAALLRDSITFEWAFGDNTTSNHPTPTHTYTSDGVYYLSLRVTRPDGESVCTTESVHQIAVGEENILLQAFPLEYDWVVPRITWGWGTWGLVGLLAISIFYYVFRWLRQMRADTPKPESAPTMDLHAPDKGPYSIPFRSQNQHIRTSTSQYRLADMLRLRQEGLRREIHVPESVRGTIESGGFPILKFQVNTRPTAYLLLLDLQDTDHFQARLFMHLTAVLRDQDVEAEVFFYRSDPNRVWNSTYPDGIQLDMLYRLLPDHRLLVLSPGHSLLDPYAREKPTLRSNLSGVLKSWKNRLLLTPVAPVDWNFQEAALSTLFVLFPADTYGLSRASRYIENGLEPGDLPPSFKEWQELLVQERRDPKTNYKTWRTLADHQGYLAHDPAAWRWLIALAVYPTPNWEVTLAIGAALDIECHWDRLLRLSRIPWLQQGDLHPRLRKQLLAGIDPEDERRARIAIKQELEAVATSIKHGFAGFEAGNHLAVQHFVLSPFDPEAQQAVRIRLQAGIFDKNQEAELLKNLPPNPDVGHSGSAKVATQSAVFSAPSPTLEDFLESQLTQQEQETPKPDRIRFTADFWRMTVSAVALLALGITMWKMDNSFWLYSTVFGSPPAPFLHTPDQPLRDYILIKESYFIDSAVQYNNQAVEDYLRIAKPELDTLMLGRPPFYTFRGVPLVRYTLQKASTYNPLYALAKENLSRLNYAAGVAHFNARRKNLATPALGANDSIALRYFREAIPSTILAQDARHAAGLCHYFLGQRDSAYAYYRTLQQYGYFDTLQQTTSLKTLLGEQQTTLFDIILSNPSTASVEATVHYYANPKGLPLLRWELQANILKGPVPSIPRAEAPAKYRRNTTTLTLQAPKNLPEFRSNTLRLQLRNIRNDSILIDSLLYWPKDWNVRNTQTLQQPIIRK